MVLRDAGRLIGLGVIAGLVLVWMGASTIRTLLFQVQPLDPTTLVTVVSLILLLAMVVSVRPALRVARLDLAQVLRDE